MEVLNSSDFRIQGFQQRQEILLVDVTFDVLADNVLDIADGHGVIRRRKGRARLGSPTWRANGRAAAKLIFDESASRIGRIGSIEPWITSNWIKDCARRSCSPDRHSIHACVGPLRATAIENRKSRICWEGSVFVLSLLAFTRLQRQSRQPRRPAGKNEAEVVTALGRLTAATHPTRWDS